MHPIENIMQTTMNELKEMMDVNTVIGDAVVTPDGSTVIPVTRVSMGFTGGGGEYEVHPREKGDSTEKYPFAGGSGGGVSVKPVGFLVINGSELRMIGVSHKNTYEKMIDALPTVIEEIVSALKSCGCGCDKQQG